MSDVVAPDPDHDPDAGGSAELAVDVTAFLPPGVAVGPETVTEADDADEADEVAVADEAARTEAPVDLAPEAAPEPARAPLDVANLERIEAEFAAVDLALAALDDGSYGRCVVCAEPIDEALLAADPVRRGCAAHPQAAPA